MALLNLCYILAFLIVFASRLQLFSSLPYEYSKHMSSQYYSSGRNIFNRGNDANWGYNNARNSGSWGSSSSGNNDRYSRYNYNPDETLGYLNNGQNFGFTGFSRYTGYHGQNAAPLSGLPVSSANIPRTNSYFDSVWDYERQNSVARAHYVLLSSSGPSRRPNYLNAALAGGRVHHYLNHDRVADIKTKRRYEDMLWYGYF